MRGAPVAALALLLLGWSATGGAQAPAGERTRTHRFFVDSVTDSTFVFRFPRRIEWVRAGLTGVVVDPRRRDALVARYRVLTVAETEATALVTGQTTFVSRDHVVLLEQPPTRFYRNTAFWAGSLLGAVIGAAATLLLVGQ